MPRIIAVIFVLILTSNVCFGSEGDDQTHSFFKVYTSLCLENILNLEVFRQKMKLMPKLPPEQAAMFLAGYPGDAWPIPDKNGKFVLILPIGKSFCAVHARKASTETAIKFFTELFATPPAPITAKQVKNEQAQTDLNGKIQTISYELSLPKTARKMLLTLTTASSELAQIQVFGSVSMIGQ
ncbi:hypothetical protein PMA3_24965 [Pseudomonas silesiensis]|uniref:Uncharacterized protein n=1 Tax=Pseudomonas silesiensis TaxID=1853130 RepID=A0A191YZB9_9PSED|nr:hypothetical protein [Pseudomonas silesiensis]ANJ58245.1 hypothetical protein PMA3_24965 [Pseudomonas silesiensis]